MVINEINACRVCKSADLRNVIDLGHQAIANGFHDGKFEAQKYPLKLIRCQSCSAVQLAHTIDADLLYRKYWYRSGVNNTMRAHLAELASIVDKTVTMKPGDIIVDIGCNDGTLLQNFDKSLLKIGVDPSDVVPVGCDIFVNDYFEHGRLRPYLKGKKAKVITSIAMFYDVEDPNRFALAVKDCLDDDGVWIVELSYLPFMLDKISYDTICHEHVLYYRISTFNRVLDKTGLMVVDAELNDINGGSIRFFVKPIGNNHSERYKSMLGKEMQGDYDKDEPYRIFKGRVEESAGLLMEFLENCSMDDKRVYGYGASTKGQVILQYCGATAKQVVAIADRNIRKHSLLTPGTNIPICSEEEMRQAKPDFLIVFPWYFMREIMEREFRLFKGGTKSVLPLPKFTVI